MNGGIRVALCVVDERPRVVVIPDGGGTEAAMLPNHREPGLTTWIRAARTSGESLQALLLEQADSNGDAVTMDHEGGFVRSGDSTAFPIGIPVDAAEIWAAGVTYLRSRDARQVESSPHHSGDFYSRVYEAERPELFLKDSNCRRTVGAGESVAVRGDSSWTVPEPEIGLVLDAGGSIVGFTIGNDMSARDIEGENPLYLAQAKTYLDSCAIGPAVWLPPAGTAEYEFDITLRIMSTDRRVAFEETISTRAMVRSFSELVTSLLAHNLVEDGTVLLTGTGIVPPDDLRLHDGDRIEISVPEIGLLSNPVRRLSADGVSS
jgi:2-dehydro-3-deoxy-D-arabinonate dehydratase